MGLLLRGDRVGPVGLVPRRGVDAVTLERALGFAYFRLMCLCEWNNARHGLRVFAVKFDPPFENPYVEILEEGFA